MISACLLAWCLGQSIAPADRVTFANDVRHSNRTERIFGYEMSWLGVMFAGGAVLSTDTVPAAGTHANFMARLQLELSDRFALTYWHWSNAHLGRHNPSVDSIGVTMRLRSR